MRAILTYHSIDPSGSPISIDTASFARHVEFLASSRVRVLPLEELLASTDAQDAVALTFDDGFVNFEQLAWPALRARGVPATLFVPTRRTGGDNRWEGRDEPGIPTLPLLDWDALGRLHEQGLSIGSHSRTHAWLTRVDASQLRDEVEGAREDLRQRLGLDATVFCYPYGDFDARVERAVASCYRWACTTEFAPLGPADAPHRLPRLDAYYFRGASGLESFGSASFRLRLALRRRARALKRALGR